MTSPARMPQPDSSPRRSMPAQQPATMLTGSTQFLHPVRWDRYPISELSNGLRCARTALIATARRSVKCLPIFGTAVNLRVRALQVSRCSRPPTSSSSSSSSSPSPGRPSWPSLPHVLDRPSAQKKKPTWNRRACGSPVRERSGEPLGCRIRTARRPCLPAKPPRLRQRTRHPATHRLCRAHSLATGSRPCARTGSDGP